MRTDPFEVGNTVLAMGRVSSVEKLYKNGNFKIAGIEGQWRQSGWRAGDTGYHTPVCVHFTEEVAKKEARRRQETRLTNLIFHADKYRNRVQSLTDEDIQAGIDALKPLLDKIETAQKST